MDAAKDAHGAKGQEVRIARTDADEMERRMADFSKNETQAA